MSDKKTVYTLFDEFLGRFKERKSLFSDKQVFTDNNLGKIVNEYIINSDEREDINFLTKLFDQLKSDESKEIMANALWIWSFTVGDITIKTKEKYLTDLGINKDQLKGHLLPQEETILHAGQYHKTNKFKEIKFLLALFQWLIKIKEDAIGKLKESIIEYIEMDRKNADEIEIKSNKSIAIQNILLHLCTPSEYEPIANYNHKKSIVDTFQKLIDETKKDSSVDKKIEIIKQKLTEEFEIKLDNGFYSDPIRSFWDFNGIETNTNFSEFDALKYKKQIIFYGPPGTSKTYKANELAKIFIRQSFIQEQDVEKVLSLDFEEEYKKRIFNLQLHPNYSYEDFIVGMKIDNNRTKWEKGYLLKLIDKIKDDTELPYVIILDEINRVDLSRLFGELFSAIENRNEEIELSAKDENGEFWKIKIPENLYFIGTMNQIDFSLERIDFALRRRFVWYFYGYDKNRLREIISFESKKNEDDKLSIKDDHIEEFIKRASAINQTLENDEEFGKEWEIGHTFFAEIVNIAQRMVQQSLFIRSPKVKKEKTTQSKTKEEIEKIFTSAKEPVKVLWYISIKPMLEAYCGNLDKKTKKGKIEEFAKIILGK